MINSGKIYPTDPQRKLSQNHPGCSLGSGNRHVLWCSEPAPFLSNGTPPDSCWFMLIMLRGMLIADIISTGSWGKHQGSYSHLRNIDIWRSQCCNHRHFVDAYLGRNVGLPVLSIYRPLRHRFQWSWVLTYILSCRQNLHRHLFSSSEDFEAKQKRKYGFFF